MKPRVYFLNTLHNYNTNNNNNNHITHTANTTNLQAIDVSVWCATVHMMMCCMWIGCVYTHFVDSVVSACGHRHSHGICSYAATTRYSHRHVWPSWSFAAFVCCIMICLSLYGVLWRPKRPREQTSHNDELPNRFGDSAGTADGEFAKAHGGNVHHRGAEKKCEHTQECDYVCV